MKRKILALLLVAILIVPSAVALATPETSTKEEIIITPHFQDVSYITPSFSVSGTTATYSVTVKGYSNVTALTATMQIQKQGTSGFYTNYGSSWSASSSASNPTYLLTSGTRTVESGGTYRLKVTVVATTSSGTSTEVVYT